MNKKKLCVLHCLTITMVFACLTAAGNGIVSAQTVTKKWATKKLFRNPESVLYDRDRDILYVANINGEPSEKDGNGFISKLGLDGEIIALKWVTGLNAPKGMGVFNGKLYVADIDRVVEINTEKGKVIGEYTSPKARFLNDISVHSSGIVYISDNWINTIFRLRGGRLEPWLESNQFNLPNGLWAEEDRLLIGMDNAVLHVDYQKKNVTNFIMETGFIDGLVATGDGGYLVSDFHGAVHIVRPGEKAIKILDTSKDEIMAADIDFIIYKRLLLVPTFFDNRVMAYEMLNDSIEKP